MFRSLTTISICAALVACHGDGARETDSIVPQASIVFPVRDAATTGATVTVTGTASDNVAVAEVRVNGILATTTDAFAHWSADVPVNAGSQTLSVQVTDTNGNLVESADSVHVLRRVAIQQPAGGEIDAASNMLYYVDTQSSAINRIALDTGLVSRVADTARFAGGGVPLDLALDLAHGRIYLGVRYTNPNGQSTVGVWKFDTQTSQWAPLSDAANGTGPALANPVRLELTADGGTLYVAEFSTGIVAVNTANGNRTTLSTNTFPNANVALFNQVMDITLDVPGNRLLVLDRGSQALFAVNLQTGARTAISLNNVQAGPAFTLPLSMALDAGGGRVLAYDLGASGVLAVDLNTGVRSLADSHLQLPQDHDDDLGNVDVRAMFWKNGRAILLDNGLDNVLSINLATHERERLANNSFPAVRQRSVYGDDSTVVGGALYVLDAERKQLLTYDASNAVQVVAGAAVNGSSAVPFRGLAPATSGNVLYGWFVRSDNVNTYPVIQSVNLTTGVVADVMADNARTDFPFAMTVNGSTGYLVTTAGVFSVNLTSGARTLLSAPGAYPLNGVRQVALDVTRNRLLLAAYNLPHLIAVDLTSGAQSMFSTDSSGGSPFAEPSGVVVSSGGQIWASDGVRGLFRIDATSGARTLVSGPATPDNQNQPAYGSGGYMKLRVEGDALFGVDLQGEVAQIDPLSGKRLQLFSGWAFASDRLPTGGSNN